MDKQIKAALWVRCPICNAKTRTKVYKDSVLLKFPLYCPKCKIISGVSIVNLKLVVLEE